MSNDLSNLSDLSSLSNEEIKALYDQTKKDADYAANMSDVKKIFINSFYGCGALASNPFSSGKLTNASVTISGRCMNKMTGLKISNWVRNKAGLEDDIELSEIVQGDTDSVRGDSLITVNNEKIKIEDYYNSKTNNLDGKKDVVAVENDTTLSFNISRESVEFKKIKYVMRHKVNKKLYKLKHLEKEIVVTEDHSVIIKRGVDFIELKPGDIIKGDVIIIRDTNEHYETINFTVECLGNVEEFVYDIEVEDNHNFFANDILVHNSNYLTLDKIIPPSTETEKALPIIQKIVSEYIEPAINENIKELCELFNVRDDGVLSAENEVISKGFVSIASKRYYTRVLVNDGAVLKKPKIKIVGIALKGKSTPELAKEKLEPILDIILDKDIDNLKNYIKETQQAFMESPIPDIARNVKVNSLDYSKDGKKYKKWTGEKFLTAPINSHASLVYNEYIKDTKLTKQFSDITPSDTISYIYLNEPNIFNSKTIAFKDPKFTELIDKKYVDAGTHFEKDFKDKIRIITTAIGWDIDSKTEALDEW